MQVLHSTIDKSVNFVEQRDVGFFESRFVQRTDDYAIVYLSSQSGCAQSCRMCHLTATKQVDLVNATANDYLLQATHALEHYKSLNSPVDLLHFNYMARGEPLANPNIYEYQSRIFHGLDSIADLKYGIKKTKHLVSTIMPLSYHKSWRLSDVFDVYQPELYYSIYSVREAFRKRWLGKAHKPEVALRLFKEWQDDTGKIPKIHFAFIEGQNDSEEDVVAMCNMINDFGLKVNFNIVRYNPYSPNYGVESSEAVINRNVGIMVELLKPEKYRIVPKVGFDVKASCGMFVENKNGNQRTTNY